LSAPAATRSRPPAPPCTQDARAAPPERAAAVVVAEIVVAWGLGRALSGFDPSGRRRRLPSQSSASSVDGSTESASPLGRSRRGSRTPAPPDSGSSSGFPPRPQRPRGAATQAPGWATTTLRTLAVWLLLTFHGDKIRPQPTALSQGSRSVVEIRSMRQRGIRWDRSERLRNRSELHRRGSQPTDCRRRRDLAVTRPE
jgi:hypothetical protein